MKRERPLFRPGVARKDDLLLVFTSRSVTAMRLWDKPAGWRKTRDHPHWRNVRPEIDLNCSAARAKVRACRGGVRLACPDLTGGQMLLPGIAPPPALLALERAERVLADYQAAMDEIPAAVRRAIAPFPERQFSLLSLAARCPGGLDLLHSTPALALLLANSWVFRPAVAWPLRSVRTLLRKRQREQLRWLGWPAPGEQTLRILRKVPAACCTVINLLYLRDALCDTANLKTLSHLPRVNRGVVGIVSSPAIAPLATMNLLNEVGGSRREDSGPRTAYNMRHLLALGRALGQNLRGCRLHSRAQLRQRIMDLEEKLAVEEEFRRIANLRFPQPPIPGNDHFQPIRSPLELSREGRAQHHCIASYGPEIAEGEAYAYRVLLPWQRATLLIGRKNDTWQLLDCRAKCNDTITESTHSSVRAWLIGAGARPDARNREHAPVFPPAREPALAACAEPDWDDVPF